MTSVVKCLQASRRRMFGPGPVEIPSGSEMADSDGDIAASRVAKTAKTAGGFGFPSCFAASKDGKRVAIELVGSGGVPVGPMATAIDPAASDGGANFGGPFRPLVRVGTVVIVL